MSSHLLIMEEALTALQICLNMILRSGTQQQMVHVFIICEQIPLFQMTILWARLAQQCCLDTHPANHVNGAFTNTSSSTCGSSRLKLTLFVSVYIYWFFCSKFGCKTDRSHDMHTVNSLSLPTVFAWLKFLSIWRCYSSLNLLQSG